MGRSTASFQFFSSSTYEPSPGFWGSAVPCCPGQLWITDGWASGPTTVERVCQCEWELNHGPAWPLGRHSPCIPDVKQEGAETKKKMHVPNNPCVWKKSRKILASTGWNQLKRLGATWLTVFVQQLPRSTWVKPVLWPFANKLPKNSCLQYVPKLTN